jgi:hypothetical protein
MSWWKPPRKPAPALKPVAVKAAPVQTPPVEKTILPTTPVAPAPTAQPAPAVFTPIPNGQAFNGFTAGHFGYRDPKADWPIKVCGDQVMYEVRQGNAGYPGDDTNPSGPCDRAELLSTAVFAPSVMHECRFRWTLLTEGPAFDWASILQLHDPVRLPQLSVALWIAPDGQPWVYVIHKSDAESKEIGRTKVWPNRPVEFEVAWITNPAGKGLYDVRADGDPFALFNGATGFTGSTPRIQKGIYRNRCPQTLRTLEEGFKLV